jgi:outer membrane protein TolC
MKKAVLVILICFLIYPFACGAEEISLTLDEAVSIALRDNRDVLLKTEEVKEAKEKIAEAKAALFPTLDFIGSRTYTRGLYAKNLPQSSTQLTLKQYLYKGGKTVNTIAQNKDKLVVSEAELDKAKLELVLSVKKAFYTLLLSKEFAGLNKSIFENARGHFSSLEERYKNGEESHSDILKIKSSLTNTKQAYEASLNEAQSTSALLKNLLYLDDGVAVTPQGKLEYQPIDIAYDEAFLKAIKQRPEIRQYEAQENADKRAIEVAKADARPSIYASWDYYSKSTSALSFSPGKGWQDYNVVGLVFSWPIFDGWATKRKVEQAILDLKETQLTRGKVIKDIALELKDAYLSLKDAIEKIKAVESDIAVYKDNVGVSEERHRQGALSSLGLDDARLKYEVSIFNKKQATYDYIIARSNFDKATGGL